MCGRFTITPEEIVLRAALPEAEWAVRHEPRWNVAPGQDVPLLLSREGRLRVEPVRWGLVPAWGADAADDADDGRVPAGGWINARAETAAQRPAFRDALRSRRAVVPADGFYEWRRDGARKQPLHVRPAGGGVVGFAAVFEEGAGQGFAILTRPAAASIAGIHDRMPVMLAGPEEWQAWLDDDADGETLARAAVVAADPELEAREVSTRVNSARFDDPGCLDPPEPEPEPEPPPQMSLFE